MRHLADKGVSEGSVKRYGKDLQLSGSSFGGSAASVAFISSAEGSSLLMRKLLSGGCAWPFPVAFILACVWLLLLW